MKLMILMLIATYRRWLSPAMPMACRYVPSCSEYAEEAVARHGAVRGSVLAAWRLLRCHPFARGGFDPVPLFGPEAISRSFRQHCIHNGRNH
jgi:putative membrane protein insertion efficiency factor